jgi:hypothetical protein
MVEVKQGEGLGRDDKSAVGTGTPREFGVEEALPTGGEVALAVVDLTIPRGLLGGVEGIRVGGSTGLTGFLVGHTSCISSRHFLRGINERRG